MADAPMKNPSDDCPHRRYNALTGEWILVSPHRTKRPWDGGVEKTAGKVLDAYCSDCKLCPGNKRADKENGDPPEVNRDYQDTYVFTNDFPALLPASKNEFSSDDPLFRRQAVHGTCKVICFAPQHNLTLPLMDHAQIRGVVDMWADETTALGREYRWVQVFENKGSIMGCSNPHPHGQVWATDFLPNEPSKEDRNQAAYLAENGRLLLLDYLERELAAKERVIVDQDHWTVVVPYWATWPFETLLLPKRHVRRLADLTDAERSDLAVTLKRFLTRYDNLFETSFPYSMGWHGAPFGQADTGHWQLHAHFYPPLLRSATVKKFMVGYEMMAEPQRDLTAEQAAVRLQSLQEIHYTDPEYKREDKKTS